MVRKDVEDAYRVLLGREPESADVIDFHLSHPSTSAMIKEIAHSPEALSRLGLSSVFPNPLLHYNTMLDVVGIVKGMVDLERKPRDGFNVNFQGVAVPTDVFEFLKHTSGQLDPIPIPGNYHADTAEWAAAFRSVQLARETFTMIELGSGWGCWMANTGFAAKRRGLKIEVIGVEGDPMHIDMCERTMSANGIAPFEYRVIRGIAAGKPGYALFPRANGAMNGWGSEPIFGATEEESRRAVESGEYDSLELTTLATVIGDRPKIDLLHIDIQGGEGDLIAQTVDLLTEKVAYVLIGLHSRVLEGGIIETMLSRGWFLEIERPTIFELDNGVPRTTIDGVQAWRNPKFNP
jgi:FkbM family methyltransferase